VSQVLQTKTVVTPEVATPALNPGLHYQRFVVKLADAFVGAVLEHTNG